MEINLTNPLKRKRDDMTLPKTAAVKLPRPDRVQQAVDTAFAEMEQLRHDRDFAIEELDQAKRLCKEAKDFIEKLQNEITDLKSKGTIHQLERDDAVARHARLQGFLCALFAQMRAFDIPVAPIKGEAISLDAEQTSGGGEATPTTDTSGGTLPTPKEFLDRISVK